ncbi:MAG TPA: hypothetical protein VFO19_10235 [Vicinamibacterales bacterium]|nr:hypothetical protein [Vicinamibacterales bacterium]
MVTYLLTPANASATTADVCVAAVSLNEPPQAPANAFLEERSSGRRTPVGGWDQWLVPDASAGMLSARVQLSGFAPRTVHPIDLVVDSAIVADATVTTLPDRLPVIGDKPFTIMLGSCFYVPGDNGRVGRRFAALPSDLRPDVKFLCGDQVYLDAPFYRFLVPRTRQGLAESFLERYWDTWAQPGAGAGPGFRDVLKRGATFFTADDHEFWNNAPFPSFAVNTWTAGGRDAWWTLASGLFNAFQTPGSPASQQLAVGDLSIFVADTRISRAADRTTFIEPAAMQALATWAAGLTSPGVLVVGQPVFAREAGWSGRVADWNLPDFEQYATLCRILLTAPQSIVMLTGDVHYGRVAQLSTIDGHELLEIIASPMSLVAAGGNREWKSSPALFPDAPIPGVVQTPIRSLATWQRAEDHFVTLELWQEGQRLQMRVRTWETSPNSSTPSTPVFEYGLLRRM